MSRNYGSEEAIAGVTEDGQGANFRGRRKQLEFETGIVVILLHFLFTFQLSPSNVGRRRNNANANVASRADSGTLRQMAHGINGCHTTDVNVRIRRTGECVGHHVLGTRQMSDIGGEL